MQRHILVTGGCGYIGSHACVLLLEQGYLVTVIDNLSNSSPIALQRVSELTGQSVQFIQGDLQDQKILSELFSANHFDAVIHFAGLKAVGESVEIPIKYYKNNVVGTINLLEAMQASKTKTLIFSSSATVYGIPQSLPISESAPRGAHNPYGRCKTMIEDILEDLHVADQSWKIARLRYFNPVGAHGSGRIGEDPLDVPNNLMPYLSQVAVGKRDCLYIFGGDYPTADGTGVRDYIHVLDLAQGHIAALNYLDNQAAGELLTVNLGTGTGISVLEMVKAFERVSRKSLPYKIVEPRPGDIASCFADPGLAEKLLGWKAVRGLQEMCADTWKWQSQNPEGYKQ